jgi:Protein of unknown function (DUF998)
MAEATAEPVTAVSRTAALLSFAGAATFVVLLAALHFIKPELDPAWHMISEYEIGRYGWVMVLAFLSLAFSCVALLVAIRSQVRTTGGRIGLALLLVCAAGVTIAAVFTSDPITASSDELTTHGNLHGLGALLGIPASRSPPRSSVGVWPATERGPRHGDRFYGRLPSPGSASWRSS